MTNYIKNPLCFICSFPDKFVIHTFTNSYCIRTHHSNTVIKTILAKIESPFSVAQLTAGLSEADTYTAQQFVAFLEQKGVIVSSEIAEQINQTKDDLMSFYIANATGQASQMFGKQVDILCSPQLTDILRQYHSLFRSISYNIHEISSEEIVAKKVDAILKDSPDMLVVATIGENRTQLSIINQRCHWANQPWIPATILRGVATYGPICIPGVTPCWDCAQQRLSANQRQSQTNTEDISHLPITYPQSMLHSFVFTLLHHIAMYALTPSTAPLSGWIQRLNLFTFDSARYRVFYFPGCQICDDI